MPAGAALGSVRVTGLTAGVVLVRVKTEFERLCRRRPCQRHSTWQVRVKSRATVVQVEVEVEVGRLSRCSPARAGKWQAPRRPLAAPGPELRPCPCQSSCHCIQVAAPGPPAGGGGPVRRVRVDPGHDSATAASLSAPAPGPLPCQCSPGPYHIGRTASAGIEKLVTGSGTIATRFRRCPWIGSSNRLFQKPESNTCKKNQTLRAKKIGPFE